MSIRTLRVGEKVEFGSPHPKPPVQQAGGWSYGITGTIEAIDSVGVRIVMDDEDKTTMFLPWNAMGASTVLEPVDRNQKAKVVGF